MLVYHYELYYLIFERSLLKFTSFKPKIQCQLYSNSYNLIKNCNMRSDPVKVEEFIWIYLHLLIAFLSLYWYLLQITGGYVLFHYNQNRNEQWILERNKMRKIYIKFGFGIVTTFIFMPVAIFLTPFWMIHLYLTLIVLFIEFRLGY